MPSETKRNNDNQIETSAPISEVNNDKQSDDVKAISVKEDNEETDSDSGVIVSVRKNKKRVLQSDEDENSNCDENMKLYIIKFEGTVFEVGSKVYGNRERKVVVNEYAPVLNNLLWQHLRLPCVWAFKRARHRVNDVYCTGRCTVCKANLHIRCVHGTQVLKVEIDNYRENTVHPPNKKRRIQKHQRDEIVNLLEKDSSHATRSKLANDLMEYGDGEPPHLPTLNAMRIMKHKNVIKDAVHKNPIQALIELKKSTVKCIQSIGASPFFVFYSSALQGAWYKSISSHKWTTISIDATGVQLKPPTDCNQYIFLYVISGHGKFNRLNAFVTSINYFFVFLKYRSSKVCKRRSNVDSEEQYELYQLLVWRMAKRK